jgi:hypothetical protein
MEKSLWAVFSAPAQHSDDPGPINRAKLARAVCFLRTLPSGPSASQTPHVGITPSRAETVRHPTQYHVCYRPNPSHSSVMTPWSSPAKFPSLSRPRVAFFTMHRCPSHPLLPYAVISCFDALRHHLPTEPPVLVGTAAGHHDAGAKHPATGSRTSPLLPRPLLALRAAPSSPPTT